MNNATLAFYFFAHLEATSFPNDIVYENFISSETKLRFCVQKEGLYCDEKIRNNVYSIACVSNLFVLHPLTYWEYVLITHEYFSCCTVPPVVADGYKEKGEYMTIEGMKTYATGDKDAKSAILIIYDIFGFFPQTLQGADILATGDKEKQYQVFMPGS